MMPPYRLAELSPGQMVAIETLENQTGLTLVAYEPESASDEGMTDATRPQADSFVRDALLDDYRSFDPDLGY